MTCKLHFYLPQFFSWKDNRHLPLFFLDMNWCDSVGNRNLLEGLHSLSSGNNLNGWCYGNVLIWVWVTQGIVTHPAMTSTVTRKWNWKARCNLHVYLHVRFFWHDHDEMSACCTFLSYTSKFITCPCSMMLFFFFAGYDVIWSHMTPTHTPYWICHLRFCLFPCRENGWIECKKWHLKPLFLCLNFLPFHGNLHLLWINQRTLLSSTVKQWLAHFLPGAHCALFLFSLIGSTRVMGSRFSSGSFYLYYILRWDSENSERGVECDFPSPSPQMKTSLLRDEATALWDMWEYLYRKSKVNVSKEKIKQHFIERLSKQNYVSGRCLKIIYVTSRCEIYLLQITYWFACKGNNTSDLNMELYYNRNGEQHCCVSLRRDVKSIDVKGYFPERNSYQQCNIEPDIERNKRIY